MKYTEEAALGIQKKYGVSDTTLRIWKHRDSIPDLYSENIVPIKYRLKKLEKGWYSDYLQSLTENQRKDFQRYAQENHISSQATTKQVQQRLRDFRRWVRKNFS